MLENQQKFLIKTEREQRADVFLRFLNNAENITAFKGQKFEATFSDDEHKKEFIENLSEEEFIELLNGINGIVRGKKKAEMNPDGKNVIITGSFGLTIFPPFQEDKPELLGEILAEAKGMLREGKDLKDVAMMVSASFVAIHPYADGNGRTSRLIYFLLANDLNDENKQQLHSLLLDEGRDKINTSPEVIEDQIAHLLKKEAGVDPYNPEVTSDLNFDKSVKEINFKTELKDDPKCGYLQSLYPDDHNYLFLAARKYLQNRGDADKYTVKNEHGSQLSLHAVFQNADLQAINEIYENYRNYKKAYIKKMIDCLAHPEKPENQFTDSYGYEYPVKYLMEESIRKQEEKLKDR